MGGFRDGTGMENVIVQSARLLSLKSRHIETKGVNGTADTVPAEERTRHQSLSV